MKIIIAVDNSQSSRYAIDSVANRNWPAGSEFVVVSVAHPLMTDLGGWIPDAERYEHQKVIDGFVEQIRSKLSNCTVEGQLLEGSPADEIVKLASDLKADFVVVGSQGRRGFDHLMLGSVAEAIVHKAACSVEVIKSAVPIESAAPSGPTQVAT